jgi:hypothetical protein
MQSARKLKEMNKEQRLRQIGVGVGILGLFVRVLQWNPDAPAVMRATSILRHIPPDVPLLVAGLCLAGVVFSFRQELSRRDKMLRMLHGITHKFRDYHHAMSVQKIATDFKGVMSQQRMAANGLCSDAERIFTGLIGVPCCVCVSLINPQTAKSDRPTCFLWASSNSRTSLRMEPMELAIKSNTRFNQVFDLATTRCGSRESRGDDTVFFFSTNLCKESAYLDDVKDYKEFYLGTIVVPIRCVFHAAASESSPSRIDGELLGFLKLETASANKLNNQSHVEVLACIADQMYTLFALSGVVGMSSGSQDSGKTTQPSLQP